MRKKVKDGVFVEYYPETPKDWKILHDLTAHEEEYKGINFYNNFKNPKENYLELNESIFFNDLTRKMSENKYSIRQLESQLFKCLLESEVHEQVFSAIGLLFENIDFSQFTLKNAEDRRYDQDFIDMLMKKGL